MPGTQPSHKRPELMPKQHSACYKVDHLHSFYFRQAFQSSIALSFLPQYPWLLPWLASPLARTYPTLSQGPSRWLSPIHIPILVVGVRLSFSS